MKTIPLRNGSYAIVDDGDYAFLMQWKWRMTTLGYAVRTIPKTSKVIWMHRVVNKTPDGFETDHINENRLDNRRSNLRTATHAQNTYNRLDKRNTSGHKGITWHKKGSKWLVQIRHKGQQHYLGLYSDFDEASKAYEKAAREYHGIFAKY